jgi:hypothetical protein
MWEFASRDIHGSRKTYPYTTLFRVTQTLEDVLHLETGRILGNDWVVRHDNRYFQVKAQARNYALAKGKVTVCEWEDGRLQIRYRGRAVSWGEIPGPVPAQAATPEATAQKQKPPTPKADHPWRQAYRTLRPWSNPGTPPVSLIHEMSD